MQIFFPGMICTRILIFKMFISGLFLLLEVKEKILKLRKTWERKYLILENEGCEIKLFSVQQNEIKEEGRLDQTHPWLNSPEINGDSGGLNVSNHIWVFQVSVFMIQLSLKRLAEENSKYLWYSNIHSASCTYMLQGAIENPSYIPERNSETCKEENNLHCECFDLSGLMSNQLALQGCLSSPLWPPTYLTKNKIKTK